MGYNDYPQHLYESNNIFVLGRFLAASCKESGHQANVQFTTDPYSHRTTVPSGNASSLINICVFSKGGINILVSACKFVFIFSLFSCFDMIKKMMTQNIFQTNIFLA